MSDKGSVFSKGGGGTNFEQYIQTAFLTTMIVKGSVPGFPQCNITELYFQCSRLGYKTDDLLIVCKSDFNQHRLLAQIKHEFSFTSNNETFKEILNQFWCDFSNQAIFDKSKDRFLIIKEFLNKNESNNVKTVLNWAKSHSSSTDFLFEINRIDNKKETLAIFKKVVEEINGNIAVTDEALWEFLKCIDLLAYDFGNPSSFAESYFLNLIKLSRNNSNSLSDKEIWDSLFSFVASKNKDGGSVNFDNLITENIYSYFNYERLSPCYKSVTKLKSDSEIIIKPYSSKVLGVHIDRTLIKQDIAASINNSSITILSGKPGVGKSAIVKDILSHDLSSYSSIIFRADKFNVPHLANTFSNQGINEPVFDILSCISLIPEKVFVIDSFEKLLEGDPENAFKQLYHFLSEHKDVKLVCISRKYAIDLIINKFGIDRSEINIIEIPELSDEEIKLFNTQFPELNSVIKNSNLKNLLRSLKYLDLAITSLKKNKDDFSEISLSTFKKILWSNIIEDVSNKKDGISIKRGKAFLNIAVKRAQNMSLFVEPDSDIEEAAIEALEKDELLLKDPDNNKYAPTHDIIEDWALIKHIDSVSEKYEQPKLFFDNLGNKPAIRRGFRLWVEDSLIDNFDNFLTLLKVAIDDKTIEKYWADELLIAIFKSENCKLFFISLESKLLEDNSAFLSRCIHLMRTACNENFDFRNNDSDFLLPTGSGWNEAIKFIAKHLTKLDNIRYLILNFILDWEYLLIFYPEAIKDETESVKSIVLSFIAQIESGDTFLETNFRETRFKDLVTLFFNLTPVAKNDVQALIEKALALKVHKNYQYSEGFYETVIKLCLSGLYSRKIAKELPETLINVAWNEWKLKPRKIDSHFPFHSRSFWNKDEFWGIEQNIKEYTSGIYKTPIYNLLIAHPVVGTKFIIEFVNYAVDCYIKSDYEYKRGIIQVEIKLADGSTIKQWGSSELWEAYRGLSVTNYLLESLLMSLEKFLLDLAKIKSNTSKSNLQFIFNYLLKNSNSVTITSLLTSVAIAYPEEVEQEMLPILSIKEFYEWDMNRSFKESQSFEMFDEEIPFAQKEKGESNRLPHRKQFTRGLSDFIINYQFNIQKINEQIHLIFDKLYANLNDDDIYWKKLLTEIDIRKWVADEFDEKRGGFIVHPKYDEDVSEMMDSNKEELESQHTSLSFANWVSKVYEKDKSIEISFQKWEECYINYSNNSELNILYDRPVSLAAIGLRDFDNNLTSEQLSWCFQTIFQSLMSILQDTYSRDFSLNRSFNLLEKEIALKSSHFLFHSNNSIHDKKEFIKLILYIISAPFAEHEIKYITNYYKTTFFKIHNDLSKKIIVCLLKYSKFKRENLKGSYPQSQEEYKKWIEIEDKYIQSIISDNDLLFDLGILDLDNHENYILSRVFAICPYYETDPFFYNYILKFIDLLINDLLKDEDNSYHSGNRKIEIYSLLKFKENIAEILLNSDKNLSCKIIDLLLDATKSFEKLNYRRHIDLIDYINKTLEFVIYTLDSYISNNLPSVNSSVENFWSVWEYLLLKNSDSSIIFNSSLLLLNGDIDWNDNADHWLPLENKKEFYSQVVKQLGNSNLKSIIKVLSTIGTKTLLPEGLCWVREIITNNQDQAIHLRSASADRFAQRLFHKYITKIKCNRKLIDDYIFILDTMVDLGSSQAYLIRENVITYKTVN